MSENLEKRIFYIFILLQPLLDLVTSLMSRYIELPLTLGIMVRSLFMVYMFVYATLIYRPKEKIYKLTRIILILIAIYIVVFLGYSIMQNGTMYIVTQIKGIIKLFYFPIVLAGVFIFNSKHKVVVSNKLLTYVLLMYTGVIFVATITGTSFRSYANYSYGLGYVGWFYAANETGTIIATLVPLTIINLIKNKLNVVNVLSIILCIFSVLYMGTKVPFLAFIIYIFGFFVLMIINLIYSKLNNVRIQYDYKKITIYLVSIIVLTGVLFYQSPLYKNLMFNYGHLIQKITHIGSSEDNKQEEDIKVNEHVDQDDVVNALLSNRAGFANEVKKIYKNSSAADKLIGLGHIVEIEDGVYTDKTIEMDFLDISYRHGIIGTILYFAQLVLIILLTIKNIFINKKCLLNMDIFMVIASIVVTIGIAYTAGHVLTAPGVAFFLVILIIRLYNDTSVSSEISY